MRKIKILYVHGLNSDGNSRTSTTLKKLLQTTSIVYSPTFSSDVESFQVMKQNIQQAQSFVRTNGIDIVIGSSMGGFIASNVNGIPRILINPCLRPSEQFYKRTSITDEETAKYAQYEKSIIIDEETKLQTYGLFSTNDELFSYKNLFEKKYRKDHVYVMNDKHRISESNIKNKLLPLIDVVIKDSIKHNKWFSEFEPTMINESEIIMGNAINFNEVSNDREYKNFSLNEAYVNAFEKEDMKKYVDDVWDILEFSYKDIGGTSLIASDKEELIRDSDMWKMIRRNGKIVAVQIYTFKRGGRKSIAGGTDGSPEGKQGLYDIIKEDINLFDRQAWSEVSHKMEYIKLNKFGAVPIPSKMAKELLPDKEFLSFDEDGLHYTRLIGGKPIRKMMVGNFKK